MGATDAPVENDLVLADVPRALALSAKVGWNQTADDWRLFIAQGRVIGLFDGGADLIATAAALPYANGFGWISMVIVDPAWRRRGVARRLMGACMEELQRQDRAALLDATPAGALVYRDLGFVELTAMERWEGEGGAVAAVNESRGGVPRLAPADVGKLIAVDADTFGAPREFLLKDFLARDGSCAWRHGESYVVVRRGHRAMQIGPLITASDESARVLLATAIAAARGPVFLDLMAPWAGLVPLLENCGFARQRPYVRMAHGRARLPGDSSRLAIAAGPEFG